MIQVWRLHDPTVFGGLVEYQKPLWGKTQQEMIFTSRFLVRTIVLLLFMVWRLRRHKVTGLEARRTGPALFILGGLAHIKKQVHSCKNRSPLLRHSQELDIEAIHHPKRPALPAYTGLSLGSFYLVEALAPRLTFWRGGLLSEWYTNQGSGCFVVFGIWYSTWVFNLSELGAYGMSYVDYILRPLSAQGALKGLYTEALHKIWRSGMTWW